MAKFQHDFEITFKDIGNTNRLTPKALLEYLETIAGMHSNEVGYGLNDIEKTQLTWVLLYWKVRILSSPLYGERLKIQTWGRNSVKFYTYRDYSVYDSKGNLVAVATSKWLLLNAKTMAIEKITPEILEPYQIESTNVFEKEAEVNKLEEPSNYSQMFPYQVLRKDIDINQHMHNICYLDLAYEALPNHIYQQANFKNIEIMYKKEIKLGEIVHCFYSQMEDSHYVTIKNEDDTKLHAIIKLT